MSDYDAIKKCQNMIKKKWKIIIIMGVIFAVVFCGYKEFKGDYIVQSDDILVGRQIQVTSYPDRQDRIQFDKLNSSETLLYDFYINSSQSFDYEKIAPGWNKKSDFQKIEWLKKHIIVKDYGAGNLEFRLYLLKTEPKNLEYMKDNGEKYIDYYMEFLKDREILGNYIVNNKMAVFPQSTVIDKNGILVKYGIIGFTLGCLLAFTIFFIKELRT